MKFISILVVEPASLCPTVILFPLPSLEVWAPWQSSGLSSLWLLLGSQGKLHPKEEYAFWGDFIEYSTHLYFF